ncbi:MAG: hypothetical protein ACSLEW_05725 [Nocardioides sp.]
MHTLMSTLALLLLGPEDRERGDVPGWVLVTVCTAAMVVVIFDIAGDQLGSMLEAALAKVN